MAFAWMAASACAFASMNFCAHVASRHVDWTMVAAARSLVGAGVTFVIARARAVPLRVVDRRGIWWRSLWGTASMLLTFYALGTPLPLGDAVTLLNLSPIFVALFAPLLLRERGGRRVAVALPISLAGVALIVRPEVGAGLDPRGVAAAIAAALCASFAYTLLRKMGPGERPEAVALHFSLVAAVVLTAVALPHLSVPDGLSVALMAGAGASGGFAQIALTRAYSLERAARVSGLSHLAVVVSMVLGALGLHEWPTSREIAGASLVVAAGLVVAIAALRDTRPKAAAG